MKSRLFFTLVVFWPAAFLVLALVVVFGAGFLANDPRRVSKLCVGAAVVGLAPLGLGFRDWFKLVLPEEEPEPVEKYVGKVYLLYSLVFAMVAAAYAFVWVIGPVEYRLFPPLVAVVSFAGVRAGLGTARSSGPAERDVSYSYDTKLPASAKDPEAKP